MQFFSLLYKKTSPSPTAMCAVAHASVGEDFISARLPPYSTHRRSAKPECLSFRGRQGRPWNLVLAENQIPLSVILSRQARDLFAVRQNRG